MINFFKQPKLLYLELASLFLMIFSLPSFEAPKNIFLVLFVIFSVIRQFKTPMVWGLWDWMFFSIILTAFLSTLFAGLAPGDEWQGFSTLLTFIGVGWMVSRGDYSLKILSWIFWMILLSTLPPLFFSFFETFILGSNKPLQLHSVGHVNHSAIYLTIIFGAFFGGILSFWSSIPKNTKIILSIFLGILYFAILIGASRAAFGISSLIGILFSLFLPFENKKKIISFMIFLLSAFVIIIFSLSEIVQKNLTNSNDFIDKIGPVQKQIRNANNSNFLAGRGPIWNTTIEVARIYPWLGIGIDNRALVKKEDIKKSIESRHKYFEEDQFDFHYKHAHSFYLTTIAEKGIVGSLVTLFFIFMWLWYLAGTFYIVQLCSKESYFWAGSASAWLATFGIGFVNTTFHHEHGILACLFLGLHLAFLNKKRLKLKKFF
jgi:O-antigen ligase